MGAVEKAFKKANDLGGYGAGGENDPFFGGAASAAATDAAEMQVAQADRALAAQVLANDQARADLSPFKEAGAAGLPLLSGAISDPSSRVLNNPFFQSMAADQEKRLLSSAAARGKVGSGGTGDDLQRNLLLLGNQFAQQDIANLQNLANTGLNAAAQTGASAQQGASAVGGILGNIGNAQAAGAVGAANARAQGGENALGLGVGLLSALSDIRLKENVKYSHTQDGIRMYDWDWKEEALEIVGDQVAHGPIAQELMKTHPDRVFMDESIGFYKVLM